jgi:hypothetical protein
MKKRPKTGKIKNSQFAVFFLRCIEAERNYLVDDQNRIRQNLQSINRDSDLGRRYVDTLKYQEDRIVEILRIAATIDNERQ